MVQKDSRWKRARKRPGIVEYREVEGSIETLETINGPIEAFKDTDYIVKDIKGYEYPIKKGIFHETYDIIEEPARFCYWQETCKDDYNQDGIRISWTCIAHLDEARTMECPYSSLKEAKAKGCVDVKSSEEH